MIKLTVSNSLTRKTIMVPSETTIRQAFTLAEIDPGMSMVTLDGSVLSASEMNKTLDEMGVVDMGSLKAVVKMDNAARITIVGNDLYLMSIAKLEDLKKVAKYKPEVLEIINEETKETEFAVCCGKCGNANKYGVEFGATATADGYAMVKATNVSDKDSEEVAIEAFGPVMTKLAIVENRIPAAIEAIDQELEAIRRSITIM